MGVSISPNQNQHVALTLMTVLSTLKEKEVFLEPNTTANNLTVANCVIHQSTHYSISI